MDGVFIGPADLSADMGFAGNPQHPEVQHTIDDAIARIRAAGKRRAFDGQQGTGAALSGGRRAVCRGGVDTTPLARAAEALADEFKRGGAQAPSSGVY